MCFAGRFTRENRKRCKNEGADRGKFRIKSGVTKIRLPWLLLNIPQPNVKMYIADLYMPDEITYEAISKITFMIENAAGAYFWEEWNKPAYRERLKKSYYILQDYLSKQ
ncbi:hypothetical protein D3Z36_01875 [Lachnospiraceae bacterium]|nr:hypothetical protein [Lachnospiraceae bacterium]